jgi:hypothetical protein
VSETIVEDTSQKPVCFIQTDGKVLLVFSNSLEEQDKFVIYNMDGTISSAITNITGIYRGGMDGSSSGEKHLLMWSYSFSICTEEFGPSKPVKPITPTPLNEATEVDWSETGLNKTLSWEDGGTNATSYDVYFGQDIYFGDLIYLGNTEAASFVVPYDTTDIYGFGTQAFIGDAEGWPWEKTEIDWNVLLKWRVDAVNEFGIATGDDWWFDARTRKAMTPTPENAATDVTLFPTFEWV